MSSQLLTLLFILSAAVIYHIPVVTCIEPWCVALPATTPEQLEANIKFACDIIDCSPIQYGGFCYYPNTLLDHASFVMDNYYQSHGRTFHACDFNHSGYLIYSDPSQGTCIY
ncbi:PREDICTED: glucan endo-1,3-beta-glucosidase-like [Camelina sativa]|uniref:Glucan endo-1,3-beta-glucosidase-like n=1 Tax=Camelina sativa TaxID=90675 RepID=A0ABM0ULJ4_CAMSA|nr:PREDICTED: glucan endo-1,3-beta-glucosidase-like [Camelina sativa]